MGKDILVILSYLLVTDGKMEMGIKISLDFLMIFFSMDGATLNMKLLPKDLQKNRHNRWKLIILLS